VRSLALAIALACAQVASALAQDQPEPAPAPENKSDDGELTDEELAALGVDLSDETVFIQGKDKKVIPGATQAVDAEHLERFEYDDVNQILGDIAGVDLREEEGYGLRPNIGMRGSGSERSAKIALLEDGILIAPAPYSAPAAYYFPLLTRMKRVEVLKGPAAIQHGPNTVAGALNLITKPIPTERETALDAALGRDLYGKLHASHGEHTKHFGLLVEGVKLRTDGFKQLDGGGDTGFDKNSVMLKLRGNTDPLGNVYNEVTAKLGYSDEISNETYTGLTDADFDANPYRRYRGTQLDRMDWDHTQVQLGHKLEVGGGFALHTRCYRNDFDRSWRKLNAFNTPNGDIASILADPTAGNNAIFYSVLTGETDSTSDAEALVIGTNERVFVSQGVQTTARITREWLGAIHEVAAGARLHYDSAERFHTEENFLMTDGQLAASGQAEVVTRDSLGSATAWALFANDSVTVGRLTASAGSRVELVSIKHRDRADAMNNADDSYSVFIPGGGLFYRLRPDLGLLAGVHKGFVPVGPGQGDDIQPEESINVELGARFARDWPGSRMAVNAEAVAFVTDYSNLKGTCTFSTGCAEDMVDTEFNGGDARVIGVESHADAHVDLGPVVLPLRATYTFNHSRFLSSFSSSNPQWGDVEEGFEIPYLPSHRLSLGVGVGGSPLPGHAWEISVAGRYTSAMRDVAGEGEIPGDERTDAITVIDAAASYAFGAWGKSYVTVSNVLDEAHIVSRRPFGARPGKPRFVIVGYKNSFF
jgi:Fe(3+) dicitrate transport protein